MSNLINTLNTAKTALLSNQKAISVTSHNIANADTKGYTRQRANFASMDAIAYGGLFYGAGVKIESIERVYDYFQSGLLRDAGSQLSRFSSKESVVYGLEGLFNDFGGSGLLDNINTFFNSFSSLANDPSSYAERSSVLSSAGTMTDSFNYIDTTIRQKLSSVNKELGSLVETLNGLSARIVDLNQKISSLEAAGVSANDLRDQRDLVLDDIAGIIDIKTLEKASGEVDVFLTGGSFLVAGTETSTVTLRLNNDYPSGYDILSNGVVLNDRISGGSIKGLLEGADAYRDALGRLDTLSANIIKAVNAQHQQGYALDGSTTLDFFSPPSVYAASEVGNIGGAVVSSASVTDVSSLTLADYEIRFTDATSYAVVNASTGSVVTTGAYTSGGAITFDGLTVAVSDNTSAPASGDVFNISVTKNASQSFSVAITDPGKIAAAAAAATLPGDNTNARSLADIGAAPQISGSTFTDYYADIVADVGMASHGARTSREAQEKIVRELDAAKRSVTGVSVEEEAINLIKLQRAYEAAAKVLSTVDSLYETILSLR